MSDATIDPRRAFTSETVTAAIEYATESQASLARDTSIVSQLKDLSSRLFVQLDYCIGSVTVTTHALFVGSGADTKELRRQLMDLWTTYTGRRQFTVFAVWGNSGLPRVIESVISLRMKVRMLHENQTEIAAPGPVVWINDLSSWRKDVGYDQFSTVFSFRNVAFKLPSSMHEVALHASRYEANLAQIIHTFADQHMLCLWEAQEKGGEVFQPFGYDKTAKTEQPQASELLPIIMEPPPQKSDKSEHVKTVEQMLKDPTSALRQVIHNAVREEVRVQGIVNAPQDLRKARGTMATMVLAATNTNNQTKYGELLGDLNLNDLRTDSQISGLVPFADARLKRVKHESTIGWDDEGIHELISTANRLQAEGEPVLAYAFGPGLLVDEYKPPILKMVLQHSNGRPGKLTGIIGYINGAPVLVPGTVTELRILPNHSAYLLTTKQRIEFAVQLRTRFDPEVEELIEREVDARMADTDVKSAGTLQRRAIDSTVRQKYSRMYRAKGSSRFSDSDIQVYADDMSKFFVQALHDNRRMHGSEDWRIVEALCASAEDGAMIRFQSKAILEAAMLALGVDSPNRIGAETGTSSWRGIVLGRHLVRPTQYLSHFIAVPDLQRGIKADADHHIGFLFNVPVFSRLGQSKAFIDDDSVYLIFGPDHMPTRLRVLPD